MTPDDQPSRMTDNRELLTQSDLMDDEPLTPGELEALTLAEPHQVTGACDDDDSIETLDLPDFYD